MEIGRLGEYFIIELMLIRGVGVKQKDDGLKGVCLLNTVNKGVLEFLPSPGWS